MSSRVLRLAGAVAVMAAVAAGCGTVSVESVEARMNDTSGVARVRAWQEPGEGLPFLIQVPINVAVVMDADASEAETRVVLDACCDDAIQSVQVTLPGPARATLMTSVGPSAQVVEDLVAARDDPALIGYTRRVWKGGQEVRLRLAGGGVDDVLAAVDEQRRTEGVRRVTVRSHGFEVSVDDTAGRFDLTEARARFIRKVAERFRLRAVSAFERDCMELWVDAADVAAVQRLVRARPGLGYLRVHADEERRP